MKLILLSCFVYVFSFINSFPGVESTDEKTLATTWAPRIFIHNEETFFPISIPEFLENTHCSQLNTPPVATLPTGPASYPYYLSTKTDKETLITDTSSFLHGHNPAKKPVPLYAAITPCATREHFIVTYYAFFGFNDGKEMCSFRVGKMSGGLPFPPTFNLCFGAPRRHFGSHIGDFESMTLEIKNQIPQTLVLSVHNVAVRYTFNGRNLFVLERSEKKGMVQVLNPPPSVAVVDGHPILYASKGSHAFYGSPGVFGYHKTRLPGLFDETAWGESWDTWNNLEIFFTNEKAPDWFYFDGKWGNAKSECTGALKKIGIKEVCTYSDGPRGLVQRELDIKCNN